MALKTYRYKGGIYQFKDGDVPKGAELYKPKPAPKGTTKPKTPATKEKVVEDETK